MRLSLFSISYAGFWGQHRLTQLEFLRKASELGFDSVMLAGKRPHLSPLDVSPSLLAELNDKFAEFRLTCDVIAGYTDLAGGPAAEVPYLEMQIAYVESLSRIAASLGAKFVRIFTSYETTTSMPLGNLWRTTVDAIREMADRAGALGVTIAIQNHHDVGLHTDALLEMLADINRSNCRLGFDAWSPALRGEDLYAAAKKAAPYTVITTNADYVRLSRYQYRPELVNYVSVTPDLVRAVPFGEGFIDYTSFFRGLREGGFDGVATYEMCSPIRGGGAIENLDRYAKQYLQWMRSS